MIEPLAVEPLPVDVGTCRRCCQSYVVCGCEQWERDPDAARSGTLTVLRDLDRPRRTGV